MAELHRSANVVGDVWDQPLRQAKQQRVHTGRRIVLTTFGSLGDLHPYIAVALGLQARGHEAVIATTRHYRQRIEAQGIGFHAVRRTVPTWTPNVTRCGASWTRARAANTSSVNS